MSQAIHSWGGRIVGKGSRKRPCCTSQEERDLRWAYAYGEMTLEEFYSRFEELKKQDKIFRNLR